MCVIAPFAGTPGKCRVCGKRLPARRRKYCTDKCLRIDYKNHAWRQARAAAKRRDKYRCVTCGAGREAKLEVNHKKPRLGRGYAWGCWHHLEGLETLCHACHVLVTRGQRQARSSGSKRIPRK